MLITEAAPWPSVVQRAGRCNRTGDVPDAQLWWLPPAKHHPYPESDVDEAGAELSALEGMALTSEELLAREVTPAEPELSVIRRSDLLDLFDTTPDLTGADLDIGPYVRDTDDLDAQLAWARWDPVDAAGRPAGTAKAPLPRWRCRAPLGAVATLAKRAAVWRFDQANGQWATVTAGRPARPGEVLVVAAKDGGYDPVSGLDIGSRRPVPEAPSLPDSAQPAECADEAYRADDASVNQRDWLSLEQHSVETRDHARALVAAIGSALPAEVVQAVEMAAYAHDSGKCHDTWQRALCQLAPEGERERLLATGLWAKSAVSGRLRYPGNVSFRHELVSMLLLDGPLGGLLDRVSAPDLVRYLVLAHHGKLRVQVRGPADTDEKTLLGLKRDELLGMPALLGQPAGALTVDLDQFALGGDRSWTRTALGLRDRYGPFVLAYLETLVRIADWRASAGAEEAAK